jgi:peptide/nickel transport system permease protein
MRTNLIWWGVRRLAFGVLLVLLMASATLVLARLAPGDVTSELVGTGVRASTIEAERARYGLDRPIVDHYLMWLGRAVRLDLGTSFRYGRSVSALVTERARNTAVLAVSALALATVVGIPLGVLAGSRRGSRLAALIGNVSAVGVSMPPLLLSLGLAFVAARTGWFPVGGMGGVGLEPGPVGRLADLAWHLVLPSLALALPLAATLERIQSKAVEEVMAEPFMRCAASRGLPAARLVWRHASRVACQPVLAVYGIIVGSLLSGSFAVEIVMAWPGLGRLTYEALVARDVELVAGCAAGGAFFLMIGIFVADALSRAADPRLVTP